MANAKFLRNHLSILIAEAMVLLEGIKVVISLHIKKIVINSIKPNGNPSWSIANIIVDANNEFYGIKGSLLIGCVILVSFLLYWFFLSRLQRCFRLASILRRVTWRIFSPHQKRKSENSQNTYFVHKYAQHPSKSPLTL